MHMHWNMADKVPPAQTRALSHSISVTEFLKIPLGRKDRVRVQDRKDIKVIIYSSSFSFRLEKWWVPDLHPPQTLAGGDGGGTEF